MPLEWFLFWKSKKLYLQNCFYFSARFGLCRDF